MRSVQAAILAAIVWSHCEGAALSKKEKGPGVEVFVKKREYFVKAAVYSKVVVNKEAKLRVAVYPVHPFKINVKFPFKVSISAGGGIKLGKEVLSSKDAITLSEKRVVFEIPFVPSSAGEEKIDAVVLLSVCVPSQCVWKEESLTLRVNVAAGE